METIHMCYVPVQPPNRNQNFQKRQKKFTDSQVSMERQHAKPADWSGRTSEPRNTVGVFTTRTDAVSGDVPGGVRGVVTRRYLTAMLHACPIAVGSPTATKAETLRLRIHRGANEIGGNASRSQPRAANGYFSTWCGRSRPDGMARSNYRPLAGCTNSTRRFSRSSCRSYLDQFGLAEQVESTVLPRALRLRPMAVKLNPLAIAAFPWFGRVAYMRLSGRAIRGPGCVGRSEGVYSPYVALR